MNEMIVLISTVIGTGVGVAGFVYWFFRNFKLDIYSKIDRLDSDIKADIKAQTARTDQANQRTDQLYQMFIDLLKAQNPKTNP